jgi:hypothetical protein
MEKILDKYSTAAVLFLTAAVTFVATPLIFGLGDFSTAIFVTAGITCTIMGCFIVLFSGNEPIDPRLVGLLPVQGCLNLCRIASDTGISGNAYFLPPRITGETRVMQLNPVSKYYSGTVSAKGSFTEEEPRGLVTIPTSDPLIQDLRKRNALVIPTRAEDLSILINETISDVYEFASYTTTTWDRNSVTITLHEYRFVEGCLFARSQSTHCCARYPCPVCSLCGTMIAECINKAVALEQCSASSSQDVTAVFSFN